MGRQDAPVSPHIAVIGMAGRFPGAESVDRLWDNLTRGIESIARFSREEMLAEGVPAEEIDDPSHVPAGGALEDADRFAASFFGYSPREALIMDPQQRLFLECSWEALERAGYGDPARYNPIGVFAAVSLSTYLLNRLVHRRDLIDKIVDIETTIGNDKDFLASRVAYKLDLRGPTVAVQSACSSSLVAVHLARQALQAGDCDIALAGGSSVDVPQRAGYLHEPEGIYSADGHCRPFDARADGMVGGSGTAVVVLKRLDRARADGDTIHAVIRGSAVNNDGANKVGYSAPSVDAQARVVAAAQAAAGVEAASIGYVEAHGTATALGDPIEVEALSEAFGELPPASCVLGAVKSNLGHLNAAAGVTGLVKAVLAVRHGKIPPTLHFTRPNPHIDLERTPFWINVETIDWPGADRPRRAGVSSFGMGGTNAHVIVEQPPEPPQRDLEPRLEILTLSARTDSALDRARHRLAEHLGAHAGPPLVDVAHTLEVGRKAFSHRLATVATSVEEAIARLTEPTPPITGHAPASPPKLAFLFPGQGAQHPGMAAAIAARFPAIADWIEDGCRQLGGELGRELERLLLEPDDEEQRAARLERTEMAQPALFLLEHSLARLWQSLGVRPAAMIGHSIGEYTAACLAGVFSLSDALELVRERGRLLQSMPSGAMLAVHLPETELRPLLGDRLVVAAINEPASSVVSGPTAEIEAFARRLDDGGIACRRLKTSHAFHSPLVAEAAEPLREAVSGLELSAPEVPFVSNLSGTWITAEEATDPAYWSRHLLQPVRFSRGLETLFAGGSDVLLEVGPGTTLTDLARRHPHRREDGRAIASLPHPRRGGDAVRHLLEATARLWCDGVRIDWEALSGGSARRVELPTYPFERQRYWIEPPSPAADAGATGATRQPSERWCHLPSWRRVGPAPRPSDADDDAPVLLFRPESATGETIARAIAEHRAVIEIVPGEGCERLGDQRWRLDPRRRDHYHALLETLGELVARSARVIHLWSLPDDDRPIDRRRGFDSLLVLAQALHPAIEKLDMICVSATSQEVTGEELLDPWQALILGPCRVIPFERADWRVRVVDLTLDGDGPAPGTGERLLDELSFGDQGDLVAYRGRHRWMPARTPLELAAAEPAEDALPSAARCLITGGTGGIGAALAEALFDRYRARLALLARTPLPERERREELLADADTEPRVKRAIEVVRRLEARGAEVVTVSADVADRDGLAAAVATVEEQLGPIDLVVHAAGVAGGRALDLETLDGAGDALAAKVDGTAHLHDLLVAERRARLVLCSSLAAEIGGFGQVGYCAANAFQDAFAVAHRDGRILAIDWDTWSETGMAVDTEVPPGLEEARRRALALGLSTVEGQRLFLRLLATGERRVLVSTRPIDARLEAEARRETTSEPTFEATAEPTRGEPGSASEAIAARPDLSTHFEAPGSQIEERLADIWQRLFGIDRIGIHDDFFELGGHSLLATQLLNRLRNIYPGAKLALATLFDAPTIASLAREISSAAGDADERLPTRQELSAQTTAERVAFLRHYLGERLSRRPAFDPDRLDGRTLAPEIVWDLRRDLDLVVYPHELEGATSLDALAEIIADLVRGIPAAQRPAARTEPPTEAAAEPSPVAAAGEKNPGMIFLLSAPRSGSTLMRLMLAGHSKLFCPPELALLSADGLRDWKRRQHGIFARDGLTRALIELEALAPDAAVEEIERLVAADRTTQQVYARLQAACGDRILLDKSPAYALDESALERAEALFETPRYLLLTRHPSAVLESLVRHRMEALLADRPVDDPWRFAESVWRRANRNLLALEERVDGRALRVRFEDLVADPETAMRRVADFLGIDFEPALLEPYAGGRMIDGPGDPDIFQHEAIEPELGEAWRTIELPIELDAETVAVAERLAYPLRDQGATGSPEIAAEEADRLLAQLDDLSDEEVEATLSALLSEGTGEDEGD